MRSRVGVRSRSNRKGYAIVTGPHVFQEGNEGGFLAKRAPNSAGDPPVTKLKRAAKTAQREYVPLEDDPTVDRSALEGAANKPTAESAKPSMQEVFGPGGFLEKCMQGGFDPTT